MYPFSFHASYMPREAKTSIDGEQIEALTGEVGRLADEVRVLRDTIEELRENLWWGILNDKFPRCLVASEAVGSGPSPNQQSSTATPGEVAIHRGKLQDVVRQQIRNEMAGLTDTLNDFSLDLQYVFRQARALEQPHMCCDNSRLAWCGQADNAAIVCQSCGFVLSDDGQLADWHDPDEIACECELKEGVAEFVASEDCSTSSGPPAASPAGRRTGLLFDVEPQ